MKALNPNTGQLETVYVKALDSLPVGIILEFPTTDSSKLPTGYMFCDGSAISRTEYSELFGLIGTKFGVGDGSTTFNLPTKAGLVSVGIKSNDTSFDNIGETGGEKTHTLTVNEMPSHTHGTRISGSDGWTSVAKCAGEESTNGTTYPSGGNQPHNNLQPYTVTNYIIKVKQTIPLAGAVVNTYSESETSAYCCDYANEHFKGVVLWNNPDITQSIGGQTVQLSDTSYNEIKVKYLYQKDTTNEYETSPIKKGNYASGFIPYFYGGNLYMRSRQFAYNSDGTFTFGNGDLNGGENNNVCIPSQVIGYK